MNSVVVRLDDYRPMIPNRQGTLGERLAFRIFDLGAVADTVVAKTSPGTPLMRSRVDVIRAKFAQLINITLKLRRKDKEEYIRFVNAFNALDKEYERHVNSS